MTNHHLQSSSNHLTETPKVDQHERIPEPDATAESPAQTDSSLDTGEPKPCPFCGTAPEVIKLNFGSKVSFVCHECHFYIGGKGFAKVLAAWNRRHT